MDRLLGSLVGPGDLVFDVGSHVGDRIASFRRLGARVVAVEPHPALARLLRLLYGRDKDVAIEAVAVAAAPGRVALRVDPGNLMVSTASPEFEAAARRAPLWRGVRWEETVVAEATTLDVLIARHGVPAFIKLDIEGFEREALAGLSAAVAALSVEFTTIRRETALCCIATLAERGPYRFNAALGETHRLVHPGWLDAPTISAWLSTLPEAANSGDIYAVLRP